MHQLLVLDTRVPSYHSSLFVLICLLDFIESFILPIYFALLIYLALKSMHCTAAYLWNMGKVVARKRMS